MSQETLEGLHARLLGYARDRFPHAELIEDGKSIALGSDTGFLWAQPDGTLTATPQNQLERMVYTFEAGNRTSEIDAAAAALEALEVHRALSGGAYASRPIAARLAQ